MRIRVTLRRGLVRALAAAGMLSMGAAVMIGAPSTGASTVNKTVVTLAETAGAQPNYIFPYMTTGYFSRPNLPYFQFFMFRPLYWFGTNGTAILNTKLSLAETPVESDGGRIFKITLRTYKWSNGTKVTTTDVMFWLNIWHQKPTAYAGWFPGGLSMPTSIKSVKVTSPTTMTITFDGSFNSHWLLYNELSQITPLPTAWTKTSASAAAGSAGCADAAYGTDDTACRAVYDFLSKQSGFNPTHPKTTINALPTYATNPLWKVVDGPWKLESFAPTEPVVFVPNKTYSGPNKPTYKELIEKPFASESAEYDALAVGTVDVGTLPFTEVISPATSPSKPSQTVKPGKNNPRLSTYNLVTVYRWGVNYFPLNFKSTGDTGEAGPIFSQLYFRQAFQSLVDQTLYIDRAYHGYAVPSYGPVPVWPHNSYASSYEETNPYPYSVSKARSLLSSHGWKVTPGGTDVCEKPGTAKGDCGKGIKKGAKLSLTLQYISGTSPLTSEMNAEAAGWSEAGIHVTLSSATFDTVVAAQVPCPKGCSWEMEDYNGGWVYWPDIYPTGEEIFASGAASNSGSYNTAVNNANITATDTTTESLTTYENWIAKELPVVWQPEILTLAEIHKGLEHPTYSPPTGPTMATFHWS